MQEKNGALKVYMVMSDITCGEYLTPQQEEHEGNRSYPKCDSIKHRSKGENIVVY